MALNDAEAFSYPHRNGEYTYRAPTPPRIIVPPPSLNRDALPDITLNALHSAEFLRDVDYAKIVKENAYIEWSFERRREAQMILPFLFLGPMTAAKDEAFLRSASGGSRITMLLAIRQKHGFASKLMNGTLRKADELSIERHTVDLADNQDLIHSFPTTTALINDHLARVYRNVGRPGKVLVFCESGNERSAGVVAAYLMETHVDVDHMKAMQLVQAQRFSANYDDAMKRLLQGYWDIICARRQVASLESADDSGIGRAAPSKMKRSLQRDEDEEMEGLVDDDLERFSGRSFAPFTDQT